MAGVPRLTFVALLLLAAPRHFEISAAFEPPRRPGGGAAIAVSFSALDPDVHVNETPAPRLKLPAGGVLVDKQPLASEKVAPFDPATASYLDLSLPVRFPVEIAKDARKGLQQVPVTLTYFYCSKRAGWCRKGSAELSVGVEVP
jgi:hypothetical protein